LRADEVGPKAGSAGRVAIHCELRIVDTDDQVVAAGEAGEILIRGDNLFSEYWRNAPATREALRDGWHYTGDIGYQDDDGFLWVHDRKKDVIISGGENIYPAEVEIILHAMADVADGVVVGLADAKWGEVPVAVVQMNKGYQVEAAAFLARFEDKIANFKRPRHVVFTDSLPRNAMGKILKHQVREEINE
jgi:fatty-acyl-CoA synthase